MSERLYYNNQYIKEFTANIIELAEDNGVYKVVLDKTAFFPGGGGQCCDKGYIDECEVIEVIEDRNKIIHVLKSKPNNNEKVVCKLDWNRRFDGMQQHLGQHVLSGTFYLLFNINTCGIHLGEEISTVDLVGDVSYEQIRQAEQYANNIINEGHIVEFITTNRREAKSMGLRRDLATRDETIRIVKIHDLDINACCGVHPSNTRELQLIKIKKSEKHKGNTRIEFLAGNRAVNDYLKRDVILDSLINYLSSGDTEIINTVKNMNMEIKALKDENSKLKAILSEYEVKELLEDAIFEDEKYIISKIFEASDMRYITRLANKLTEEKNRIVLFANRDIGKGNLLFACSKNLKEFNMGDLLKDSITLIDGKGGGSKELAQGGGKNVANMENAIEYSIRKVRGTR